MDIETIKYTAEDMLISNLCLKWYLEVDDEKKKLIFDEIQTTHKLLYPNYNMKL
tara:strand:+ start:603 stop:764 length:162 start_codon:yes stop_codon:yes gene_type:complete